MNDDSLRRLLFFVVYTPFAVAVLAYVVTGGAIDESAMVKAAFSPLWLPLVGTPLLLAALFIGLAWFDLGEFV